MDGALHQRRTCQNRHVEEPERSHPSCIPGIGPIVASCLSASVPEARLFQGGREFALIAPGLTAEDAPSTAERIRAAIADNGCDVTASIGVATYPSDARDAETLIAAADQALYRSKHEGRDRVTLAGTPLRA